MLPFESPELVDQVIKAAPNHNERAAMGMEADQSEGIGVHTSQPCFLPTTSRGVIPSNRRLSFQPSERHRVWAVYRRSAL
ncbi:hypothetical protein V8C40DRAFT_276104 [Trichoderma camerunense]